MYVAIYKSSLLKLGRAVCLAVRQLLTLWTDDIATIFTWFGILVGRHILYSSVLSFEGLA